MSTGAGDGRLVIIPSKCILIVEDVVQELTHFELVYRQASEIGIKIFDSLRWPRPEACLPRREGLRLVAFKLLWSAAVAGDAVNSAHMEGSFIDKPT